MFGNGPSVVLPIISLAICIKSNATIKEISIILSQVQNNGQHHPITYISRLLTAAKCNYRITKLEILAVMWSITHFHLYLYDHQVTVFTDYSAVQVVLNGSEKYATWWSKLYGSGVSEMNVIYYSGKDNSNSDVLS